MKGVVFTAFHQLVAEGFGEDMLDDLLDDCALSTGGAYTSVGTYDHDELLQQVAALSQRSGKSVAELVEAFGGFLFGYFTKAYPHVLEGIDNTFDFLAQVEGHIHVEVLKLYNDAQLPTFTWERDGDQRFVLRYQSSRPFALLAYGLIQGCISHFGESIDVELRLEDEAGTKAQFTLTRKAADA